MKRLRPLIFLFTSILLTGSGSAAQEPISLRGTVRDANGVPIPGATVRLAAGEDAEALETLTDVDGAFGFDDIFLQRYRLTVEMDGFQRLTREGLDLSIPGSRNLTLTLQNPAADRPTSSRPGRPGTPPGAPGRRPRGPGQAFQEVTLADIPGMEQFQINPDPKGGDPAGTPRDNSDVLLITGTSTASIFAGDMNDPNFRRDLMDRTRKMGFRMEGMTRGAGGGRFGGGGAGGGGGPGLGRFGAGGRGMRFNQARINGSANITYSNSLFNARPYSLTGAEVGQPLHIQNNFGASLGGPLPWGSSQTSIRRRMGRRGGGRGQWFFSYSGNRNRNPYDVLTTVPTPMERQGDFSQSTYLSGALAGQPVIIYDLLAPSQIPFPDAKIPASRLNPASLALLEYIPEPNLPGSVQNFTMQRGLRNTGDNIQARLNTPITSKHNMYFNYSTRRGGSISSQRYPELDSDRGNRAHNAAVGGTYRIQARCMINYRINFNHVRTEMMNDFAYNYDVAGDLGIGGVSRAPENWGIPIISFTNYGNLGLGNTSLNRNQTFTLGGGLNRIGTTHSVRIGADMSWVQRNRLGDSNARGTFNYTGFTTSAFDSESRPISGSGYDLADFLLGFPYSTSRQYGSSNNYLRGKTLNMFVEDNWRVRPNLTINLGLRYEYIQPFYEKYNRIVNLSVSPDFSRLTQVFPHQEGSCCGSVPRSLIKSDKNNFGPRIGIAWKPSASSRWVFRTGYGLFYNPSVYPYIYGNLVGQPPFAVGQNVLTTRTNPLTLQNGFPEIPDVTILNTYAIDPSYRIGYVQQWNFNVQTQIRRLYALEVGYNGSRGTHLDILRAPNRAPPGVPPGQTEDNRFFGEAGNFLYQESSANSVLHSLQVRLNRRFSQGMRIQGSYTLSKSIDNASRIGGGGSQVVQDDGNISAERSLSSFDQRHRFEAQFYFDLPFGERRRILANASPFLNTIIAGWSLNGTYQLISGTPLTARILGNVSNNSGTGSNYSERPDATGVGVTLPGDQRTTFHYFNTGAFAIPEPGQFGNAGRYTIPGPGTNLLSLSLRKSFVLDDNNRRVDFRWQVSNALNHPNFGGVATTINATNAGRVTSVRTMRQMQFHIRINF